VQLTATVRSDATILTDRVVGWTSSNDAVAVVSATGLVVGRRRARSRSPRRVREWRNGVRGSRNRQRRRVPDPTSVVAGQTRQLTAVAATPRIRPCPAYRSGGRQPQCDRYRRRQRPRDRRGAGTVPSSRRWQRRRQCVGQRDASPGSQRSRHAVGA
jgi:hypothetical protein